MAPRLTALLLLATACGLSDAQSSQRQKALASPLCQSADAKAAFNGAICVCEDLNLVGAGLITRSSAGLPANVGANGADHVVGHHEVGGAMVALGGVTGVGQLTVSDDLSTRGDIEGVGQVTVGHDLMVGGRISSVGELEVSGTLGIGTSGDFVGAQHIGTRGAYVAPAEPCGCAAPAIDVAARIADAKSTATALAAGDSVGQSQTTLRTGSYYTDSLRSVGSLELTIDGAVALYIGRDLQTVGGQTIRLTPGSTLDLYVGGSLSMVGGSIFGEGASPGSVRVYLGSDQQQSLSVGSQQFNASIYAPRAELSLVGDTEVNGAVFARSLTGVGLLNVDYSAPAAANPDVCAPPDGSGGAGGGSGEVGTTPPGSTPPAAGGGAPEPG